MSRATFVFDVDIPPFMDGRIFELEHARKYPGAEAFAMLGEALREAGLETVTADTYLARPRSGERALVLSNELTRFTDDLLAREEAVPVATISLESPIVAIDFYSRIEEVSRRYRDVFLWSGMGSRVTGGATFHEVSWPYPSLRPPIAGTPWAERRFLVLVNSKKRIFVPPARYFDRHHPRGSAKKVLAAWRFDRIRRTKPWLNSELYKDRLDAIRHFSRSGDFDLYGYGWSDTSMLSKPERTAVGRSYRGELPALDKVSTLSDYRFALCFENTAFPGYVTEKIFDCFAAGCIPIYLGAPNIKALVPAASFIDARDFGGYAQIESFIRRLTPDDAADYLSAATAFMTSPQAERFRQDHLVSEMADLFRRYAAVPSMTPTPREEERQ